MSKKNKVSKNGFVYSTNPDFQFEQEETENIETLPNQQQKLRIWLDTKQRAGKTVTLISGFIGSENDIEKLTKQLKNFCGTGGSTKNNEMIIQGDQREKILQWLLKNGYSNTKKAGG
ncbi:MAG: translation initiation factor [Chitinophagaceae bacterium]|nr:translation initiation factor [Chitinophagaceae bacterium]MCW5905326.1 translation initiation factor [Chitinophagaceae bacterium]